MDLLCNYKTKIESQHSKHGISKTSVHMKFKIKKPNPSQEPPASYNAPNHDLKDIDVLCTFKIKMESQNLEHEFIIDK